MYRRRRQPSNASLVQTGLGSYFEEGSPVTGKRGMNDLQGVVDMLKFLASTVGIIFLIGLLVVIGLLMLIF
ncbi:hypothetical protein SAMN04487955_10440 [Halomonas korlensis]|uniref:Uncharacterized protein n=2 Tax=Halomonas korlensis TaxID=463301 RepID=A0A1I7H8T3_9GAMM|nr:hypothetical protein SAMN04487955_10440 [Halomonas korlensis]